MICAMETIALFLGRMVVLFDKEQCPPAQLYALDSSVRCDASMWWPGPISRVPYVTIAAGNETSNHNPNRMIRKNDESTRRLLCCYVTITSDVIHYNLEPKYYLLSTSLLPQPSMFF